MRGPRKRPGHHQGAPPPSAGRPPPRSIEPVVERYLPIGPHAKPPAFGAAAAKGIQPGILRYCLGRPYLGTALQVRENVVHEAILLCFFRREELVPLDIAADRSEEHTSELQSHSFIP